MTGPRAAILALESLELPVARFRHRDHIEMAWNYLEEYPLQEAIPRFCRALRAFAAHHGRPDLYHETITWAYLLIVNERRLQHPGVPFPTFADENPDLFVWPDGVLSRYYTRDLLRSDRARGSFTMPDRLLPDGVEVGL